MPMTTHGACAGAPRKQALHSRGETWLGRNVAVAATTCGLLGVAVAFLCAATPAGAQSPGGAAGEAAEALHLRPTPPPAAEFVERARPDQSDYQRLGPTDKANHKKSSAELDALASSLENARAANLRAAQRVRATDQPAGAKTAKAKLGQQDR
jgi:hypothetical protein